MTESLAVRELIDGRALEQLLVRYFDRIDANDPEGAAAFMTADVAFEIMIGRRKVGRDRFTRSLGRVLERYERTSHHVTNVRSRIDGDEAELFAYVYAYHRMRDSGAPWHLWARLEDRAHRIGGDWLISEHMLVGVDAEPQRPDVPREWYPGHPDRHSERPSP